MAIRVPVVINNGQLQQLQAGDSLAGIGSGGDINFTTAEAINARDVVYINGSGLVAQAQANAPTTALAFGFAPSAIAGGASGAVRTEALITGFAGLTPGQPVYLSPTVDGGITQTAPTTVGQYVVRLGMAISATDIEIEIDPPILL